MDKIREFQRVTHEEDRRVIPNHIPVAFFSIKFESETAHVPLGVSGPQFTGDGGKTGNHRRLLANFGENICPGIFGDVMGYGKSAMSPPAFRMHDPLRNTLPVLMSQFFKKLVILHEQRPSRSSGQRILIIRNRRTGRRGHGFFL